MKLNKQQQAEREKAIQELRRRLPPGTVVYTMLRHVSRSGMQRSISCHVIEGKELCGLDYWVRLVTAGSFDQKHGGLKVSGCGMDMGFELVYRLGRYLYPEGFAPSTIAIRPLDGKRVNVNIGRGRGAGPLRNEEIAELAAKGWLFEKGRNGDTSGWDNDGGYALQQRWT